MAQIHAPVFDDFTSNSTAKESHFEQKYTYAMGVEYLGTAYRGWQRQQDAPSIQQNLEECLGKIANYPIEVIASGRTDAGVHASNMIAHFCSPIKRDPYNWIRGANSLLPDDIAIRWLLPMPNDFHARFRAIARRYRYITFNQTHRPAILRHQVTHEYHPLDLKKMQKALHYIQGQHDFSSFRAAQCQSNQPIRNVHFANLSYHGELLVLDIQADGFLHHMVRNLMGSLFVVGRGDKSPEWFGDLLLAKDRRLAAPTASADGLYFINALYPEPFNSLLPKVRLSPSWLNLAE